MLWFVRGLFVFPSWISLRKSSKLRTNHEQKRKTWVNFWPVWNSRELLASKSFWIIHLSNFFCSRNPKFLIFNKIILPNAYRIWYKIGLQRRDVSPKTFYLKSRSQVSLEREFIFRNSKKTWRGVPIIAANMDTVGTFEMATALAEEKIITAIHKHYTLEEWSAFLENSPESIYQYIAISSGTGSSDEEKN